MKNYFYATLRYQYFLDKINHIIKYENKYGTLKRENFPDGERYTQILDDVREAGVFIIGSTSSDSDLMEIYELATAAVKYGAKKLTLVIPYFGYSTMERAVKSGEVVGAKVRARLLSSLPQASGGNRILLLDLHSEGIPYYFEGDSTVFHVYAKDQIIEMIQSSVPKGVDYVIGSTDAGRAKWVASLAHELRVHPAFVYKTRMSGSETQVTGVNADVKNRHVVIYDDMIRSGSSIIQAAQAYRQAGAVSISLVATHGIFTSNTLKKEQVIDKILKETGASFISITDSHLNAQELMNNSCLKIYSSIINFTHYLLGQK